jgi:NadR type nicotinamide-nucleotide adenylyltransferase
MRRGFLLGKFMPPHLGHQHLCEVALSRCDHLTVLVCSLPDDPIPGRFRYHWMREIVPAARVLHLTDVVPQAPSEHPDFWPIWRAIVRRVHPEPVDVVFASEVYGHRLAAEVGAVFEPVDIARVVVPVSATMIRADPIAMASFLPRVVRDHLERSGALGEASPIGGTGTPS